MKKFFIIACILLLTGCNQLFQSNVVIDWVDFLQFEGEEYLGSQLEIADPNLIGEKIGEIKHMLEGNVRNPNYKSKNGDAAFLSVGTVLYEIKNEPNLIAIRDKDSINGYKIYYKMDKWKDFPSILKDEVARVQLFDEVSYNQFILRKAITEKKDISQLIDILQSGKTDTTVAFDYSNPKMSSYVILVYTSAPVAEKIPFFFDGEQYFWYNHDSEVMPDEIEEVLSVGNDKK
ncbi:hypothetical protein [Lederbergia panacisoli]|uniref:hypothetical protein n=1 Tax=Lederbergia panacisoli TaxID=1255251 RepID=UPI00214C5F79|nr:hypothetical protein [Lederbergia panacisoli]MCR2823729.1 hypothetical protein [Lederbergia panacisoli]